MIDSQSASINLFSRILVVTSLLARMLVLVAMFVGVTACSTETVHWIEEAQLRDGRIIQVEREEKYKDISPIGGPATALPLAKRLKILSDIEVTEWMDTLDPVLLDIDPLTREWILICTTGFETEWRPRGSPSPPYWQFRLQNGTWLQEPVSEFFYGRVTNLLVNPFGIEDRGRVVNLNQKNEWTEQNVAIKRWLRINRESRFGRD